MQNYIQKGDRLVYEAAAAVASGAPVVVGTRIGVAAGDIAAGESGVLVMEGVFSLPKVTGAIDQGTDLYFDADGDPLGGTAGSGAITATATGNVAAGYAFAAALAADTHVLVKLDG